MLSHRNLVANVLQLEHPVFSKKEYWDKGNEVLISPLPFFHIYGFVLSLNCTLGPGRSTLVSMPSFDFVKFLELVQKRR